MILAALVLVAGTAQAGPADLSFGVEADGVSRYLFRGLAFSRGPALQPSAWVTLGGGTFEVWGHVPLTKETGNCDFHEVDPSLDWAFEFGDFGVDVGAMAWVQTGAPFTVEGMLHLSYAVGWGSLFLEQALDLKEAPGSWYAELGAASEHEAGPLVLAPRLAVAFADAAYNDYYVDTGVDWSPVGLERGVLGLDVAWAPDVAAGGYLRVHGEASMLLDAVVRDRVDDPFLVGAGLALGWEGGGDRGP
ncbi:MAG: hypothetical protein JXB39_08975 [Deltaproteobacteria bacterium]|nr:hypothetical protein [Deltaproteobacteria bacterium]